MRRCSTKVSTSDAPVSRRRTSRSTRLMARGSWPRAWRTRFRRWQWPNEASLFESPFVAYMEKIAVGPEAAGAIDITAPVATNLKNIARALDRDVRDLTVVMLDRPRHEELARDILATGARIRFIMDGDVAGAVMAAMPDTGIDVLMGIGGAPEAVVAACAIRCIGGRDSMQALAPQRRRAGSGGRHTASTSTAS